MPRIIVENISREKFAPIANRIAPEVAEVIKCPEDWISVSRLVTEVYTEDFPVVNVYWFPRDRKDLDAAADTIYSLIAEQGFKKAQIYFHNLDRDGSYDYK